MKIELATVLIFFTGWLWQNIKTEYISRVTRNPTVILWIQLLRTLKLARIWLGDSQCSHSFFSAKLDVYVLLSTTIVARGIGLNCGRYRLRNVSRTQKHIRIYILSSPFNTRTHVVRSKFVAVFDCLSKNILIFMVKVKTHHHVFHLYVSIGQSS